MSGQKYRISLSQAMAMQAPLDTPAQIAEARAKAKQGVQVELEDLIAASKQADATRESFKKLAAPPSAQKRVDGLKKKGRLGEIAGYMLPKRGKREARPPKHIEQTAATPTAERAFKAPYGLEVQTGYKFPEIVGGQVRYRLKTFMETYAAHMRDLSDAERQAADLLIAGFENAERVTMVSARAYTGAPYTGNGGHTRLEDLTSEQIDRKALFEEAYGELTRNTPKWWTILHNIILREPAKGRDKALTPQEIGSRLTAYRAEETSTAAGVMATKLALIRWLEALQTAMAQRGQRRQNRAALQAVITQEVERKRIAKGGGR